MRNQLILALSILALAGCAATTPTRTTEQAYMVIDVKADATIRDELLDTIIETAQSNMSSLSVNRGIPPSSIPETASRFELVSPFQNTQLGGLVSGFSALSQASGGATMKIPQCKDPLLTMKSDKSASGWSERTTFFICVVQYQKGYQVDVYTTFEQQTGGVSVNALSQSLVRSIAGDTSQSIPTTMVRIRDSIANLDAQVKVKDSYIPSKWKGLFADDTKTLSES
ncbi:hypothetical protein NQT72_00870 [Pseudoalteromonas carrageenovora]|uniref:hypothetical protein n=1 Tax=Pseudoalteromonas carrageenovora TaxID=227 RepID=UPI0021180EE1|nr:hypothetical protein [Pseudoalteromonas carrageenovora]MCQ8888076.1 hypothetical protein [Pseudoalteromonas carrageenovora]